MATFLNRHVHHDYNCLDPIADLLAFAKSQGISEAFVGQMTAVSLQKARAVTLRAEFLTVAAVVTAGLCHNPGLSSPVTPGPGTINMILLIDACLTPAAMVNAVITATEVKTQVLMAVGYAPRKAMPQQAPRPILLRWPVPAAGYLWRMPAQ